MLRFIRITHLAVIDSVEVEFGAGLNVLTGETGAGKSILVGAVALLLGGRASGDLVRSGEEAASIEAIFERGEEEILVRREITANGRSRAFINGALTTAGSLRDLAEHLIELHGQREHQTLLDPSTHLGVLDAFGRFDSLVAPVGAAFKDMRVSADALSRLRQTIADREARLDLLTFQLAELDRAGLKKPEAGESGEDVELAALRQVLANAERVERLCQESYSSLYENDGAILAALGHVWRRVSELSALDPQFKPYLDARDGIKSQLEDLAQFLRRYADAIEASPARLHQVEERLALLDRLKRKYGPSLDDVVSRRDALRAELADLRQGGDKVAQLEREHAAARERYLTSARLLGKARRESAGRFAREIERLLAELAMERTRFEVRFLNAAGEGVANEAVVPEESAWTADGIDVAEFLVSPNPGEDLRPLARIASGGELARMMLAIKTLTFSARLESRPDLLGSSPLGAGAPGLVFDEVDAGIGGRVADVVGRKLQALGSSFQVLSVTHLPQIAACGDAHFGIEKRVDRGRTSVRVRRLEGEDRVNELARMLGGESITEVLKASAREMLRERATRLEWAKGESERAKGETLANSPARSSESKSRKQRIE